MKFWIRIILCLFVIGCYAGCTYQRHVTLRPAGLPETYFPLSSNMQLPVHHFFHQYNVGVFTFSEPDYAKGMGQVAAQYVAQSLRSKGLFNRVTAELEITDLAEHHLINIARMKQYDLIISGDLTYYFEGSETMASRVDEQAKIILVSDTEITPLWFAKTTEICQPKQSKDLIFLFGKGAKAPSSMGLLQRNAEKIGNLFSKIAKKQ
ncbi:MAG: hypothetical protein OMM_03807 [Candidatus Magnetoglobus multicellularis str. Araruama]|uniref:Uncharacterized protein n=1 Tax=Candidatus Magnetoglobus multicellularis str. Araruama TaxID=890399 RepID=A0A1V1P4A5_9BACT|nr:MAG: hypothetical protein OMM_03807 [Candidatus Magnetoglobus multicellularis str. Araruama]